MGGESLTDLYRQAVIEHSREAYGKNADIRPTHSADGHNALCGDSVTIHFRVRDGAIEAAAFSGESCAICTASSALLCRHLAGSPIGDVVTGRDGFAASIRSGEVAQAPDFMQPLVRVRRYPARVECAMLPWDTAVRAARGEDGDGGD
ncbi:MAG: iron-sulfur cluster assembly scaffold protein [Xanthomonadales bacterium]|nr:iron-sulfur cluster assembly scaffold protein [Xanthomonadales bacterium]